MIERWVAVAPGSALTFCAASEPPLGPDDLLVAVEAAVIGAPEAHALDIGRPVAPGGAAVGRVARAGAAAEHRIGERVLVGPVRSCFECDVCRRGHPSVCPARLRLGIDADGALASHVVVRARATTGLTGKLEGAVPGPLAALLPREAALAYEMVVRAGLSPGEVAIWVGGGAIAELGAQIARAKGVTTHHLTADERALPPDECAAAVRARIAGTTPRVVFEVSARGAGRARAAALAGPGMVLVLLAGAAAGANDSPPLPAALLDDDVTCVGVAGAHPDLLPELCALAARGEIDLAGAADLRSWTDVPAAIAELRTGRAGTIVVARG